MTDKKVPPAVADFLVAEHAAKRGPVKSLYVEIKREEVEGMRARIAELEQQRGGVVLPERANVLYGTGRDTQLAEAYNDALDEVTRLNPPGECVAPQPERTWYVGQYGGETKAHCYETGEVIDCDETTTAPVFVLLSDVKVTKQPHRDKCVAVPRELLDELTEAESELRDNPMRVFVACEKIRALLAQQGKPDLVECDACPTSGGCVDVCMKAQQGKAVGDE